MARWPASPNAVLAVGTSWHSPYPPVGAPDPSGESWHTVPNNYSHPAVGWPGRLAQMRQWAGGGRAIGRIRGCLGAPAYPGVAAHRAVRLGAPHNRGLDNVTVEQIAAEAEISTRTFFRYFRNVATSLNAVPRRESRRMCQALLERPADESLLDGFHAWFHEIDHGRDLSSPTARVRGRCVPALERDRAGCARRDPVRRAERCIVLTTELEEVVRLRLGFGADDERRSVCSPQRSRP